MMLSVEVSRDARQIIINPRFTRRRGEHGEKPAKIFTLTLNDGQFIPDSLLAQNYVIPAKAGIQMTNNFPPKRDNIVVWPFLETRRDR